MDKQKLIEEIRGALEALEFPCENIETQPGLQWFMPLGEDYRQDYALGEMFFASDLTDQDMNGVEIVQLNAVFKRGIDPERVDALHAFFAKVNRMLTGGRFDAQLEESCFAEYGHDVILPLDLTDEQAAHAVKSALELMAAYIGFVYEGVTCIAQGEMTPEAAISTRSE